jgi:hypothetical protein
MTSPTVSPIKGEARELSFDASIAAELTSRREIRREVDEFMQEVGGIFSRSRGNSPRASG